MKTTVIYIPAIKEGRMSAIEEFLRKLEDTSPNEAFAVVAIGDHARPLTFIQELGLEEKYEAWRRIASKSPIDL